MRIGLVGGGSGGHFYPLMAVVEKFAGKVPSSRSALVLLWPYPLRREQLKKHNIQFVKISSGNVDCILQLKTI